MHARIKGIGIIVALAAVALASALPLASEAAGGTGAPAAPNAACRTADRGLTALSYSPAYRTYDDEIEDSGSAPDFCAEELVTNDNDVITLGIHAHNRSGFQPGDTYTVYLDADRDGSTGGGGSGAEYQIAFDGAGAQLEHWNGSVFDPASAVRLPLGWAPGYGPVLLFRRGAIGNPSGFNFVLVSANGGDGDRAPDTGSWSYTQTPFMLTVKSLALGPPRAGRPFTARALVLRSDFDVPLTEGRIACGAKLAGRPIAGKGRFASNRVVCSWGLPKNARGKRLSGSVAVTFEGAVARRSFSVRVR
jgi:hypothetical protein